MPEQLTYAVVRKNSNNNKKKKSVSVQYITVSAIK